MEADTRVRIAIGSGLDSDKTGTVIERHEYVKQPGDYGDLGEMMSNGWTPIKLDVGGMTLMPTENLLRIGADDKPLPGEAVTYLDGDIHNEDGRLTAYGFLCGYVEKHDEGDENRLSLSMEHEVFHVKGFIGGKHTWEVMDTLDEARETYDRLVEVISSDKRLAVPAP